jgi:ornithine cyclodeaminase/alanine dehydrogenase-like protein (mu-crystallin family)
VIFGNTVRQATYPSQLAFEATQHRFSHSDIVTTVTVLSSPIIQGVILKEKRHPWCSIRGDSRRVKWKTGGGDAHATVGTQNRPE